MEAMSKADFCKLCEMHRESAAVLEDVMRSFSRYSCGLPLSQVFLQSLGRQPSCKEGTRSTKLTISIDTVGQQRFRKIKSLQGFGF